LVGTPCEGGVFVYDPDKSSKGTHAYPYSGYVWAYDLDELAAVRAGTKQMWEVVPYHHTTLDSPYGGTRIAGAAYDASSNLLYLTRYCVDWEGGRTCNPVVDVYEIGTGGGDDETDPTVAITSPTSNTTYSTAAATVNLSGTASDNVAVTGVTWSCDVCGSGSATGTSTWTINGITLAEGANVITVTAADAAANDSTDVITVTYTPVEEGDDIAVVSTTRLTHPAYRMGNNHFGTRPYVWSRDGKRLHLWEERESYTTTYGTKTGRGPVWGWVADCDSHDCLTEWAGEPDPLAAYESYAQQVYDAAHISYTAACAWSPLVGEENILICPYVSGSNTVIKKTNVDTDAQTTLATISGDNTVMCYGFDSDNKFICSANTDGDWTSGGWRINTTTGASTAIAANYPYTIWPQYTCNQTPKTINADGWGFPDQTQNGHGGRNSDSTLWANNYGGGTYPGVINTSGVIKRASDECEVIEDTTRSTYHVTHMTWNAWPNRFIASSCGDECNSSASAPNLDTMRIYQVDFDPTAETYDYTEIKSFSSAGRWSSNLNFEAIPISTVNDFGTQIIFNSSEGKYTYEDHLVNSALSWGLEGVFLMEITTGDAEEQDTTAPTIVVTSPTAAATYETESATLTVSGTAYDETGLSRIEWMNSAGGSGTATGTGTWSATSVALTIGENVVTVTAYDTSNNSSTDSITITRIEVDTTDPTVTITSPTSSATYSTAETTIALSGTASDNVAVTAVTWSCDVCGSGSAIGTATWSIPTISLELGANVITVTAADAEANDETDVITITRTAADTTDPEVTITGPTSDPTYASSGYPFVDLSGTSSDNIEVASITWANDRGGSGVATGTTTWGVLAINVKSGDNVITVTAHDSSGNVKTDSITITYTPGTPDALVIIGVRRGSAALYID
jgi:hypothetical protein